MKGGRTPIHIQRWAPADYHADEHVKLLKARRDYRTLTFYRHFLDFSFGAGGDLPADPEALAAVLEMPRRDVEAGLEFCLGRLLQQDGGRVFQKRVRRDVTEELEFRETQRDHGKNGGRPRNERLAFLDGKGTPQKPESPPAPCAVRQRLSPAPASPPAREDDPETDAIREECRVLLADAVTAMGLPAEMVLTKASRTPNGRSITSLDGCRSGPWLRTTRDRLVELRLQAEAEGQGRQRSPRLQATPDQYAAADASRQAEAEQIARERDEFLARRDDQTEP